MLPIRSRGSGRLPDAVSITADVMTIKYGDRHVVRILAPGAGIRRPPPPAEVIVGAKIYRPSCGPFASRTAHEFDTGRVG